ncbi:pentapeptide repeat-containing protein [Faecalimonas umbilicata]|uniref:pentapeptide repeat-containing protein n=1 Tax=Faecalimonas umbilicata TaxID=1912855 RepID=UPI0039913513
MKRQEPLIETEPPVEVADGKELMEKKLREELPLAGVKISEIVVEEENYERIGARRTVFENCRFLACDMERCEFSDVIFRRCDFSNTNFRRGYFKRCLFENCKGVGVKMTECLISHVRFSGCMFSYANLDGSKLEYLEVAESSFRAAGISDCFCREVWWEHVELSEVNFFKTSLRKMNFTTCEIGGILISDDNSELDGAEVNLFQAVELSKRLGIIIKEEGA